MHERTKKIWFAAAALAGVILTLGVMLRLAYRWGGGDAQDLGRKISAVLDRPVSLSKIRFLLPGKTDLFGIQIKNKTGGDTVLFCPELKTESWKSVPSKEKLLEIFPAQKRYPGFHDTKSPFEFNVQRNGIPVSSGPETSFRNICLSSTTFADKIPEKTGKCVLWTIPELYVRFSELERLGEFAFEWISRYQGENDLVFFKIEKINILYNESEFNELIRNWRSGKMISAQSSPDPKQQDTVTQSGGWLQDGVEVSHDLTCRWIKDYNSSLAQIRLINIEGMFFADPQKSCFDFGFTFDGIPCTRLYNIALFQEHELKKTWFSLNTNGSPFPMSFASFFNSFFCLAGKTGWFSGILGGEFYQIEKDPRRIWTIKDFHLYQCDIAPFAQKATPTRIDGTLVDFLIESGSVQNGVFTGKGDLFLRSGSFDKTFMIRLGESLHLNFEPVNTLSNQFRDDLVPFDELAFSFEMSPKGIAFDSKFARKIIGFFKQSNLEYRYYLPENAADRIIPYPDLLTLLATPDGPTPFWTEYYRDAINHLPVQDR